MLRMPAVSRLAWPSRFGGAGEGERRSPVEIVATMGTYLTRTHAAEVSGLRAGPFGRWADGVTAMRADCVAFAGHWRAHNEKVLQAPGPPFPITPSCSTCRCLPDTRACSAGPGGPT